MAEARYLTERERDIFIKNGCEADIPSVSRSIGKQLKHHEDNWTTPTEHQGQKPPTTRRLNKIVLLGPEGAGKSALGNLLVGEEVFMVAATSESGARVCRRAKFRTEDGREWEVVDTPGSPLPEITNDICSRIWRWCFGSSDATLLEMEEEVRQADVIIFVLNTSHKRTPDMGFSAFNQIFPHLSKNCMLVTTHGNTHYKTNGTAELLNDIKESPEIREFLRKISEHVVIVELGDGQQSEDAILDGNVLYDEERRQARRMVMAMVDHTMLGTRRK